TNSVLIQPPWSDIRFDSCNKSVFIFPVCQGFYRVCGCRHHVLLVWLRFAARFQSFATAPERRKTLEVRLVLNAQLLLCPILQLFYHLLRDLHKRTTLRVPCLPPHQRRAAVTVLSDLAY